MHSTANWLATSPQAWPPIPSQTTARMPFEAGGAGWGGGVSLPLSSFPSRTQPTSVCIPASTSNEGGAPPSPPSGLSLSFLNRPSMDLSFPSGYLTLSPPRLACLARRSLLRFHRDGPRLVAVSHVELDGLVGEAVALEHQFDLVAEAPLVIVRRLAEVTEFARAAVDLVDLGGLAVGRGDVDGPRRRGARGLGAEIRLRGGGPGGGGRRLRAVVRGRVHVEEEAEAGGDE